MRMWLTSRNRQSCRWRHRPFDFFPDWLNTSPRRRPVSWSSRASDPTCTHCSARNTTTAVVRGRGFYGFNPPEIMTKNLISLKSVFSLQPQSRKSAMMMYSVRHFCTTKMYAPFQSKNSPQNFSPLRSWSLATRSSAPLLPHHIEPQMKFVATTLNKTYTHTHTHTQGVLVVNSLYIRNDFIVIIIIIINSSSSS